jgi:hypothetical protein
MCDCIADIDARLKEQGLCLAVDFSISEGLLARPHIPLMRLDKLVVETRRSKPNSVVATYCPWCGVRYSEPLSGDKPGEASDG